MATFKIELDLDDISEDIFDGESLSKALISNIRFCVVEQLRKICEMEIDANIKKVAREQIPQMVETTLNDYLTKQVFQPEYGGDKVDFATWLEGYFSRTIQNRYQENGKKYIDSLCEKFAKQLKERYDLQFAAHIVKNMAEQKLLKDEAIAKLLDNKK